MTDTQIPASLIQINTGVNEMLTYAADTKDYWQTLEESKQRGMGDCDDHACSKFHLLTNLGFTPYLMVCLANKFGEPYRDDLPADTFEMHMVCVCNGFVLDNKTELVVPLEERVDLSKPAYMLYRHCGMLNDGTEVPLTQFSKWHRWLERSDLLGKE